LGTTVTNQNLIQEKIKRRFNSQPHDSSVWAAQDITRLT
jgi:hypothetical protein